MGDVEEVGRRRTRRWWIGLVGVPLLLATTVVVFSIPSTVPRDTLYMAGLVAACAYAWTGFRRAPAATRVMSGLIAAGLTTSSLGDAMFVVEGWLGPHPDVSWSDLPHFATYPLLAAALVVAMFPPTGRRRIDPEAVIDALTVAVVCVLVLWNVSVESIVLDLDLSPGARLVWAGYPIADAMVMAIALRTLSTRRSRELVGGSFAVGIGIWLTADLVMNVYSRSDTVLAVLGPCWLLGTLLMAHGAWQREPAAPLVEAPDPEPHGRQLGRLVLAICPLLVPPVLELVRDLRGLGDPSESILVGTVALVALTFWRTVRLLNAQLASQAEVARSRRFHAQLAATSSDAVIVLDAEAGLLGGSERYVALMGSEPPRSREAWLDRLGLDEGSALAHTFDTALAEPGVPHTVEVRASSGGRVGPAWLSARIVNLLDDPDVRGVVVALSDITERKEIERELAQARDAALEASRAKSAFLATMSHEIRTPMNGVIGLTRLLLTTEQDERQRTYTEGVRTAGEGLLTIINDILDFSKVEAGKLVLESIDLDLVQIVEDAADTVAGPARDKGLELLSHCAADLPRALRGDPSRLRQVLLNLASNAVKFTEHGEVVLRARVVEESAEQAVVRFEVSDTGIGISEEAQRGLFDAFSQADSSTTRKYGGTGLGLAIVRQLVTAMGGEVGVTSSAGRGSTFWFTVPLARGPHEVAAIAPSPPTGPPTGPRALVVAEGRNHREILDEQLTALGLAVDAVDTVRAAVHAVEQAAGGESPYRLAVVDRRLPGMDGVEVAALLSAPHPGPPLGIVLLTDGADITDREAEDAGIGARVAKPVHRAQLRHAVGRVLRPTDPGDAPKPVRRLPERVHRGHLLVVEDSDINQMVALGILQGLGFTAEVADNGVNGLVALAGGSFDAVLMDCQMPEMDGYEATRRLRERESRGRLTRTPVIAMTASVTEGERERCLAAGMDDFVAKPVSPEELDAALRRWVVGSPKAAPFSRRTPAAAAQPAR